MSQERADATMALLESEGVNHIDTARSYGESELRLAPWLADNRDKVFLATKTGERAGSAARAELEDSLDQAGRRPGRPHPVAQPRRAGGVGRRVRCRRSGRGIGEGPGRRSVQVHRGHRARSANPVDASAQPSCVRLRLGAVPVQLRAARAARLPGRRRGAARTVRRAQRGRADHQVDRPRSLVGEHARASSAGTSR